MPARSIEATLHIADELPPHRLQQVFVVFDEAVAGLNYETRPQTLFSVPPLISPLLALFVLRPQKAKKLFGTLLEFLGRVTAFPLIV